MSIIKAAKAAPARTARIARHPGGDAAGSAVLVFFGLLVISSVRRQQYPWISDTGQPDAHRLGVFLVAAAVVAISAKIAPDLVTALLIAALIVAILGNEASVVKAIEGAFGSLSSAAA